MKRRKKRGVYFVNRPAPMERAWLLEHGASEEDMGFPDPKTDPLAGLFPDKALRERFAPLVERLGSASSRELLFDEERGILLRAFIGIGPADIEGDHPEGLILLKTPDSRSRIPGLPDDAPGAREMTHFYRGALGALCGGCDRLGLAVSAEVLLWSKARKHNLDHMDFLPEHRNRNLRILWDRSDGTETVFDAAGRVFEYRGGDRLLYRGESVMRFLEEMALRVAAGKAQDPLTVADIETVAPGHAMLEPARLRSMDIQTAEAADLRMAFRKAEAVVGRDELAEIHLAILAREERWEDYAAEMRRVALGPARSLVDHPAFWKWLFKACAVRGRHGEFRDLARAAAAGPLGAESRGSICDLLIDGNEIEAAVAFIEQWMRPGQAVDPGVTRRIERIRSLRRGGLGGR